MRNTLVILSFILFIPFKAVYADTVAVIGGGAAGLTTAFLTEEAHDVTLYEAEESLGGHAKTDVIEMSGKKVAMDVGAEFFNKPGYPNFIKLLEYLGVAVATFTLGLTIFNMNNQNQMVLPLVNDGRLNFSALWPSNLLKLIQLKWMMYKGRDIVDNKRYDITIESFIGGLYLTRSFKNDFLYPLLASGWGLKINDLKALSAFEALKYLIDGERAGNTWLEVRDGMGSYIEALVKKLNHTNIQKNSPIESVTREGKQYRVTKTNGDSALFDQVVFAVNPKLTAQMTRNVAQMDQLRPAFEKVQTFKTIVGICPAEGDNLRFLPRDNIQVNNIRYNGKASAMAMCKPWKTPDGMPNLMKIWLTHDVRARIDSLGPMPDNVLKQYHYDHLYMDLNYYRAFVQAQKAQGKNGLWFVGVQEDDSHETAISTAVQVASRLSPHSSRLGIFA